MEMFSAIVSSPPMDAVLSPVLLQIQHMCVCFLNLHCCTHLVLCSVYLFTYLLTRTHLIGIYVLDVREEVSKTIQFSFTVKDLKPSLTEYIVLPGSTGCFLLYILLYPHFKRSVMSCWEQQRLTVT